MDVDAYVARRWHVMRKSIAKIRREELIEAAKRCVVELGVDQATVRDIARYGGFSAGSILYYFSSKDELLAVTFLDSCESLRSAIEREMALKARALDKLEVAAEVCLSSPEWQFWLAMRGRGVREARLATAIREAYEKWLALLEEVVREGIASGEFRVEEPGCLVFAVSAIIDGFAFDAMAKSERDPSIGVATCAEVIRSVALARRRNG
jgi:AcrR family transcriptional regulator